MITVLEAINLSADYLAKKNIESPRINAELLLAHALNCKRLDLYLSYDRPLAGEEIKKYREILKRRGNYEPLQYITGKVEFYGMDFIVNRSVLIPRPETEILVETILENVQRDKDLEILDIGTGSGIISVSLAGHLSRARVTAVDLSGDVLNIARKNAENNSVASRINFREIDIFQNQDFSGHLFDIVVSNPPYVSLNDFEKLSPELRIYEPKTSLTDFSDGFKFYHFIMNNIDKLLKPDGKIFFETGDGQAETVKRIMEEKNFMVKTRKDYLNIDRVIYGVRK
jgi:release factor glutamine methyltransferase